MNPQHGERLHTLQSRGWPSSGKPPWSVTVHRLKVTSVPTIIFTPLVAFLVKISDLYETPLPLQRMTVRTSDIMQ